MTKVIKNGTIVTADRTWKADVLVEARQDRRDRARTCTATTSSTRPAATSCRAASTRTRISKCRSWAPIRPTISRAARARRCPAARRWWSISACRRPASRCSRRCRCGTTRRRKARCDYSFHMAITWWGEQVFNEMATVVDKGITSFKHFMAYKGALMVDDDEMYLVVPALRRARRAAAGPCRERRRGGAAAAEAAGRAAITARRRMPIRGRRKSRARRPTAPS